MTEEIQTEAIEDTEEGSGDEAVNEDTAGSSPEKNEDGETPPAGEGGQKPPKAEKDTPFHEHPRWKQRESAWEKRFNDQEARHQDDLKAIREEFGKARSDNEKDTKIPAWFNGDQEQWDSYRADLDAKLTAAEERAYKRLESAKTSEQKAVDEATAYMRGEIDAIQSDTELNPDGRKVDPNKLLRVVMDNDLVDSKGRWNYRAAWRMIAAADAKKGAGAVDERKRAAAAAATEDKPEKKPTAVKTAADFKKNRPW